PGDDVHGGGCSAVAGGPHASRDGHPAVLTRSRGVHSTPLGSLTARPRRRPVAGRSRPPGVTVERRTFLRASAVGGSSAVLGGTLWRGAAYAAPAQPGTGPYG